MRVSLRVNARVPFAPEEAFAWWTDYRETDHDAPRFRPFGWTGREILERDERGKALRLRDSWRVLGQDLHYESSLAYDPPHAVIERSDGPMGPFWSKYAFEPTWRKGTRIQWTIRGRVTPLWAKPLAAVPGLARALALADLRGHVEEMRRDLEG